MSESQDGKMLVAPTSLQPDRKLDSLMSFLIYVAFGAIVLVIGAFVLRFWNEPLASSTGEFGQFGDYIGGLLNPVMSFLTLLAVLYTLRQAQQVIEQNEGQLEQARTAMQAESDERARAARRAASLFALDNARMAIDMALAKAQSRIEREVWLDGARMLNRGLRLAAEITEPAHQDVWQILLHGFRERARSAVGFQNSQLNGTHFIGTPALDLESAVQLARQIAAGYQGNPPRLTPLAEQSVFAFFQFGALLKEQSDVLRKDENFPPGAEDEIGLILYPGVREWLRYIRQHPHYMLRKP